jgi:hypothetical protein
MRMPGFGAEASIYRSKEMFEHSIEMSRYDVGAVFPQAETIPILDFYPKKLLCEKWKTIYRAKPTGDFTQCIKKYKDHQECYERVEWVKEIVCEETSVSEAILLGDGNIQLVESRVR